MSKGTLLVLTGASSVGKAAIREQLLNDPSMKLFYSISMTTRLQKPEEQDGVDYYFVDQKTFASAVRNHELLEYTQFDGYYYGTPLAYIDFLLRIGKNVLLEVEAQGVGQIKLKYPEALAVFVMPESMEELERQIRARYNDTASADLRVNKASMEMELSGLFRHQVKNTDPDKAKEEIRIMMEEHQKKQNAKKGTTVEN